MQSNTLSSALIENVLETNHDNSGACTEDEMLGANRGYTWQYTHWGLRGWGV